MKGFFRRIAVVLALVAAVATGTTGVLQADTATPPCAMMAHGDDGAPCTPAACPVALCAVTPFVPPVLNAIFIAPAHVELGLAWPADCAVDGEDHPPPHRPPIA
jgi:hypothetical protein